MIGIVDRKIVAILYAVRVGDEIVEANLDQHLIGPKRRPQIGDTVEMRPPGGTIFKTPFIIRRLPEVQGKSGLPQDQSTAAETTDMNSAEKATQHFGLNSDSQGNAAWVHGLLAYMASDYEGGDTHPNPCREILLRLESRGCNQHVLSAVKQFLSSYEIAFDAGKAA